MLARPAHMLVCLLGACGLLAACATSLRELRACGDQAELAELLRDERSWVREEAALRLGELGGEAPARLLESILQDERERWYVRAAAARALSRIGDARSFGLLSGLAARPELEPEIKIALIEALCACGPEQEALQSIAALAGDQDLLVAALASSRMRVRCAE
ncbi:MAG: HEAT repeat domain-containing protein [Deltaproteobacteria bacterium]|nr:HEAT repeat domain-containing protein [Deltaproteobacteria bacterium]